MKRHDAPVPPLPARTEAHLRAAQVTAPPGLAVDAIPPAGFRRFSHVVTLDRRDLDATAAELFSWQVQRRAGLRVQSSDAVLVVGTVVLLHLGLGRAAVRIPCRVVEVVDEPGLKSFTYATLPGHPERGLEKFALSSTDDGRVRFTVSAVSQPATRLARMGGPLTRAAQDLMTRRYLAALQA